MSKPREFYINDNAEGDGSYDNCMVLTTVMDVCDRIVRGSPEIEYDDCISANK